MAIITDDSASYINNELGIKIYFAWNLAIQSTDEQCSVINTSINFIQEKKPGIPDYVYWRYKVIIDENSAFPYGDTNNGKQFAQIQPTLSSYKIRHNEDGSCSFNLSLYVYYKDNTRDYNFKILDKPYTLPSITAPARFGKILDFNDEENPTINYRTYDYTNYQSLQACVETIKGVFIDYKDIPVDGTSYTFELTNTERENLRSLFIDSIASQQILFKIKTVINGKAHIYSRSAQLSLINYIPTLSPTIIDDNALTVKLTGDSTKFIRFYSNAKFTTGATAYKGATIVAQSVVCGSTKIKDSSSGTVVGIDSNIFYFEAKDSRGLIVKQSVILDTIDYTKLTCNTRSISLSSNGTLTFTISGNYFNSSFGAKNNSLVFECGYKPDGGDMMWRIFEATPTFENNKYTLSTSLTGFDYKTRYSIVFNVIDELSNAQSPARIVGSISVFDWSKTDFRHNTDVCHTFGTKLTGENASGTNIEIINPCNDSNALVIGKGNYDINLGSTDIWGKTVNINGRAFGENKVLWSGASQMNGEQSITLSESISSQVSGIVLVFSGYDKSTTQAKDDSINTFFVSKKQIELFPSVGHTFILGINAGFSGMAAKYLYFTDTTITGHAGNTSSGTNSSISYNNSNYVLRYVIGV